MSKKIIYAIIPARAGSKGIKDKNIKLLDGKPLISYTINFAKALGVDKVICSTNAIKYADIARELGAEVPFLRSDEAAEDTAMEQDILKDLYQKFKTHNIPQPDYLIWLRPTFIFRDIASIKKCIEVLNNDITLTSARTVCETECRLYTIDNNNILETDFKDHNKSMIRRQDIGKKFKVYSTDIIRADKLDTSDDFLGRKVYGVEVNKICGYDIDDEIDFSIVESLVKYNKTLVDEYLF